MVRFFDDETPPDEPMKICAGCGLDKPLVQFRRGGSDGLSYLTGRCAACREKEVERGRRRVTMRDLLDRQGMPRFQAAAPNGIREVTEDPVLVGGLVSVFKQFAKLGIGKDEDGRHGR